MSVEHRCRQPGMHNDRTVVSTRPSESGREKFPHVPYQLLYPARQFLSRLRKCRILFGGQYWDRTSGPRRVKAVYRSHLQYVDAFGSQPLTLRPLFQECSGSD
jgi:hypothetical protein